MGIIKAAFASADSMARDQYKEYFYCDAIPADIIMKRAFKMSSERSDNKGSDDIVTDGSIIAVADGEYAIVVSNGKVIAEYKESGPHTFTSGDTGSVFSGGNLGTLGKEFGKRFSFGGDTPGVVHRVYYFNTKEMPGDSFSGANIPFRIKDDNTGLDIDCTLSVSGGYTYRVANPKVIYKQMIGNIEGVYRASYLLKVMTAEVKAIILEAFGMISADGMRASKIAEKLPEIENKVRELTKEKLYEKRGIELVSFFVTGFGLTEKESGIIRNIQQTAVLKDPEMAKAALVAASAHALTAAAENGAGAMMGVAAVSAVNNTVSQNTADTKAVDTAKMIPKFCTECGAALDGGKFCRECGHKA